MPDAIVHQNFNPQAGILSFYTYDVLTKLLHDLVEAYPRLAHIESIGKSFEGRKLWLVTLTNQDTGPAIEKSAYWIDGNTHAGEVTGSTVVLYTLWSYLTHYGTDETITHVLDRSAIYLLPRLSVDGAERYLTTPYFLRSSTRLYPYTDERDGFYRDPRRRRQPKNWFRICSVLSPSFRAGCMEAEPKKCDLVCRMRSRSV